MNLALPERLESMLDPGQTRLDLAVGMYTGGRITLGSAAEIGGISIPEFQRELGRRQIAINYTDEDLAYDLQAAADLMRP